MALRIRLLVAGLAVLSAHAALAAEKPWLEVKTAHFTVLTNSGEGSGREVAWEFEQMRAALQKLWPWARLSAGKPILVLAAKDQSTLRALAPQYWEKGASPIVSVSVQGRDRHYLALQIDSEPGDDIRVNPYFNVYRAYVHIALDASFDRPLPVWLSEGMAELFGNLRVRDKDVFLGRMVPWHVELLKERVSLPLATLFAVERDSPEMRDDYKRQLFDAESWGLLHYLIFGDAGGHAAQLTRYTSMLLQGSKVDAAIRESFPDLAVLEKGFDTYIRRPTIEFSRIGIDVSLDREKFPARPVPAAESAALRAAFHVAMGRPAEALAMVQQARAADPAYPGTFDAEGLLADSAGDDAKALAAYGKAVELGSTNFYTFYRDAQLRAAGTDRATRERNAKSLEKCVELNPEYASGFSYLAATRIQLGRPQDALEPARRAVALEPGGSYHHVTLASALQANAQHADALAEAQRALDLAGNDHDRRNATEMLGYLNKVSTPATSGATSAAASESGPEDDSAAACGAGDGAACARILPGLAKSCDGGDATACGAVAWIYENGAGVAKSAARVAESYQKACAAGDKSACAQAAWLEAKGEGVPKNEAKGTAALEALCNDGTLQGCRALAIFSAAKSTPAGIAKARALLKKGCDGGDKSACSMLASLPK